MADDEAGLTAIRPRRSQGPTDIRRFWAHFRPFHRSILFAGAVSASVAVTELALLAIVGMIISGMGSGSRTPSAAGIASPLTVPALLVCAVAIVALRAILTIWGAWLDARLGSRYEQSTRATLVAAYLRASWPAQSRRRDNELQEVATTSVTQGRVGIKALSSSIGSACSAVIMLAGALTLSWLAAVTAIGISLAIAAMLQPLVRRSKLTGVRVRDLSLGYVAMLGETVNLVREIRLTGVSNRFSERLDHVSERIRTQRTIEQTILAASPSLFETGALAIVIAGLAVLYSTNFGETERFIAMLLLLLRASQYGRALQGTYHQTKAALPYLDIIDTTCEELRSSEPSSGDVTISGFKELKLSNVSYKYQPGEPPALNDISLSISQGEVIGIIGPSGSGKSTLVDVLLGLRLPTDGTYNIDDVSHDRIAQASWSRIAGLVTQDPQLIEGDLADNIRFMRPDISASTIEDAIRDAGLDVDLTQLSDGIHTRIGPRGMGLSGGQRQRLCIARVLAGQPRLLILDEPTSSLDVQAENIITETIERLKISRSTTILIVAHRLTTLRACDRVAVIRNGTIEAFGDRDDLARRNDYYMAALDLAHAVEATDHG